jgi:hypothetical protein
MAKQPKLKTLLEGIFEEKPQINKFEVAEGVKSFSIVGKSLYNNSNIMEIAKQISHIAEQAHGHVLSETNDWFDQVSVNKNMQSLKKRVAEFKKAATEAHQLNQRMTGLYEDMGHILNRYYDINEELDPVGKEDGDVDNDGDQDDADSYLQHKRKVATKAIKGEVVDTDKSPEGGGDEDDFAAKDGEDMQEIKRSLKDIGGVVGLPALGQFVNKFRK